MRWVEVRDGYLIGTVQRQRDFVEVRPLAIESLTASALLQDALNAELRCMQTPQLLIDARLMAVAPTHVNDSMWRWLRTHPRVVRVAVVNYSTAMNLAVSMRAIAQRQRIVPFREREAAAEWLAQEEIEAKQDGLSRFRRTSAPPRLSATPDAVCALEDKGPESHLGIEEAQMLDAAFCERSSLSAG